MVGILKVALNTSAEQLHNHLSETIPKVKSEEKDKQLILGMDHNLDLIKKKNPYSNPKIPGYNNK